MNASSTETDLSLFKALFLTQYRLKVLFRAIVTANYLDTLFAAARFRTALEYIDRLAQTLPGDRRLDALRCLDDIRALAGPILELVPRPADDATASDPEQRWRRTVLRACLNRRAELDALKRSVDPAPRAAQQEYAHEQHHATNLP